MSRTLKDVIRDMHYLLSDPRNWTQGAVARDKDNKPLSDSLDPRAVCWCLVGAYYKVDGPSIFSPMEVRDALGLSHAWEGFVTFNDDHTHEEVIALLRRGLDVPNSP